MLSIPLFIFLLLYLVFLAILAIFFLINFSHLVHTGGATIMGALFTLLILTLAVSALFATAYFTQGTDWRYALTLDIVGWLKNLFTF